MSLHFPRFTSNLCLAPSIGDRLSWSSGTRMFTSSNDSPRNPGLIYETLKEAELHEGMKRTFAPCATMWRSHTHTPHYDNEHRDPLCLYFRFPRFSLNLWTFASILRLSNNSPRNLMLIYKTLKEGELHGGVKRAFSACAMISRSHTPPTSWQRPPWFRSLVIPLE